MSEKEIMTADEFAVKHGYKCADEMPDKGWREWVSLHTIWDVEINDYFNSDGVKKCFAIIRKTYKEGKNLYMRYFGYIKEGVFNTAEDYNKYLKNAYELKWHYI